MPEYSFDWVDAFTETPFGGNACAVVFDLGDLPVHDLAGRRHGPAKHLIDALVAEAHAQDGKLAGEGANDIP